MAPYPNPSALEPEGSFSPISQEVSSPSMLNPYHHSLSSLLLSPFNLNYEIPFAADALPSNALDASALPSLDPVAGMERTVLAPPATTKAGCRKRSRADRHSKIRTSQGLRDRRMRLSVDVSRRFFRLQDMLGFDKASRTIDWLLTQSKSAIEHLAEPSSVSECEVGSSINSNRKTTTATTSSLLGQGIQSRPKEKVAFEPMFITQESRDKARARARERTIEKKRIKSERSLSNTRKIDQMVCSKDTNIDDADQIYRFSQMTMISSWLLCNYNNNNEVGSLLDEQQKINFQGYFL